MNRTPAESSVTVRKLTKPRVLWARIDKEFGMRTQVAAIEFACGHAEQHHYPLPAGTRPMSFAGILRSSDAISTCPIAWRVCARCAAAESTQETPS